jgi:hypothetical protein
MGCDFEENKRDFSVNTGNSRYNEQIGRFE